MSLLVSPRNTAATAWLWNDATDLPTDGLLLQAIQDEMETRLVGLREDFQTSQQQLVQQFAQHQVLLECCRPLMHIICSGMSAMLGSAFGTVLLCRQTFHSAIATLCSCDLSQLPTVSMCNTGGAGSSEMFTFLETSPPSVRNAMMYSGSSDA